MPKKGNDNNSDSDDIFECEKNDHDQSNEGSRDKPTSYTNDMLSNSTTDIPKLLKLVQGSVILDLFHRYGLKIFLDKFNASLFVKNPKNIKYITLCTMLLFASSLMGALTYYFFSFMTFYASCKCILWLFEAYDPATDSTDEEVTDHYVVETSASDVIEYCIVPIFIRFVMMPLTYLPLPIPFLSSALYSSCIMISLVTMTSKMYRQKLCIFIKELFTGKNYEYGKESELHRIMQTFVYTIECTTLGVVNLSHNPRKVMYELDNTTGFSHAFSILASGVELHGGEKKGKVSRGSKKTESSESKFIQEESDSDDSLDEGYM